MEYKEYDEDLSFACIALAEQFTEIDSRSDVDITSNMGAFSLHLPVFSANMPQITGAKMCATMAKNGGMGVLHRHDRFKEDIEANVQEFEEAVTRIIQEVGGSPLSAARMCAVSVGVKGMEKDRFKALHEAGAEIFCIDVAHGNSKSMKEMIEWVKGNYPTVTIIAGNIASAEGARNLSEWGADIIKVGIGPGCFVKNTKVATKDGTKNIQDIKDGDIVLTHKGNYKKVIGTMSKREKKSLIRINNDISCTKNHEFFVLHKKYKSIATDENINEYAEWVDAGDLTNDYLLLKVKK
jgi:IMP dehydrogenase/GMP reductase